MGGTRRTVCVIAHFCILYSLNDTFFVHTVYFDFKIFVQNDAFVCQM